MGKKLPAVNTDEKKLASMISVVDRITAEMKDYHIKALVLFGSLARLKTGAPVDHPPKDIDLLAVTNNPPLSIMKKNYGCPVQLHHFTVDRIRAIAKSLRYDSRPVALAKLYGSVLARKHSIDVIAAAMMLGPDYGRFGIEQIEIDGIVDKRDYSVHLVLSGEQWWGRLCRYASQRRGPWMRFTDKIVQAYEFT